MKHSFTTGTVASDFKTAIVKPLLKKPSLDPNALSNYRPISNLPLLSKIPEKICLPQLLAHIDTHNLLSVHQSAYCDGHGTETDLLSIVCRPHCLRIRWKQNLCSVTSWSISIFWHCWQWNSFGPSWIIFWYPQYSSILVPFLPLWKETICYGSR